MSKRTGDPWRLGARLTNERHPSSGEIDGHDAFWAFTLSDGHCTLYYYFSDDGMIFVWTDRDAGALDPRLFLPHGRRREWMSHLQTALGTLYQ